MRFFLRFDALQESSYSSSMVTIDVEERSCNWKLAMWVLNHGLLQSGSCHLVSEDVASTGSLDPDPDATSYRSHFLLEFIGWLLLVLVKVLVFF